MTMFNCNNTVFNNKYGWFCYKYILHIMLPPRYNSSISLLLLILCIHYYGESTHNWPEIQQQKARGEFKWSLLMILIHSQKLRLLYIVIISTGCWCYPQPRSQYQGIKLSPQSPLSWKLLHATLPFLGPRVAGWQLNFTIVIKLLPCLRVFFEMG